jgi:16S rRNA (uracil1498-N3)-methyltransferase
MRRRFFVDSFDSGSAALRGDTAEHLGRVLRAEPGQIYELSDGNDVWLARIERVALAKSGKSQIDFSLVENIPSPSDGPNLHLLLSIVKFDRFEWCLEKATELGVTQITPLAAARTDKPLLAAAAKRHARWEKILLESAQQSRRLRVPTIGSAIRPVDAFGQSDVGLKLLLSERREAQPLRDAIGFLGGRSFSSDMHAAKGDGALAPEVNLSMRAKRSAAVLAIGPEGGWTDDEIAAARAAGFAEASLGESILRTETAVIAALAILHFVLSDPKGHQAHHSQTDSL